MRYENHFLDNKTATTVLTFAKIFNCSPRCCFTTASVSLDRGSSKGKIVCTVSAKLGWQQNQYWGCHFTIVLCIACLPYAQRNVSQHLRVNQSAWCVEISYKTLTWIATMLTLFSYLCKPIELFVYRTRRCFSDNLSSMVKSSKVGAGFAAGSRACWNDLETAHKMQCYCDLKLDNDNSRWCTYL